MTYEELKSRLVRVESALQTISNNNKISKEERTSLVKKFNIVKENIQKKLNVLNEQEGKITDDDIEKAKEYKQELEDIKDELEDMSEVADAPDNIQFDRTKMPIIATAVGKALAKALIKLGDEIASMKAHRLDVNTFDVLVIYKGEGDEDEFSFHIENGNLHIADFSYNEKLVEIGVKPSGDPIINEFNLIEALVSHFRNLEKIRSTNEDIDVGHEDNEPSMIKKQLYRIMKDAKYLYDALGKYEGSAEVDFPSWWQSKITKSQSYLSGAHDYLDSEENEKRMDNLPSMRQFHEALDSSLPDTSKMSLNKLQKVYGMIVDRMLELNDIRKEKGLDAMYMGGSEPGKHSVRDHLVSLTRKKKQVAGAIDDKVAGIGKGQELTNEGDLAYVADEDYQTIRDLIQFIDDHADNFEKNPQMEPALKFLKGLLREEKVGKVNEMLRHSVIAKHDGYELVKKSNTPELTIAKKGKSVGNFRTSGNEKEDIKQFQKMVKSGNINEGTDLYDGDKFSMKRFAGPNGIALQITAPKLKGGGYEYIQIDGDTVKEFARAAVHVAQEFHDVDRQFPVNESFQRAVNDIPGLSDEDKKSLVTAYARLSQSNFVSKGNKILFHDDNTIQQMGKRAKQYSDRLGISSNTPYMNSLEYFQKKQFNNVKSFIDSRLTAARLGLKHVTTGPYTKKEIAVYKPLLQDQVAMLMHLQGMDDASLENLFKKNPSSDPQWKEIFRKFPQGNSPQIFQFKTNTDIASIKSKAANVTADDAIDGELGNALANLDNSDDFERLMQAVEKLKAQGRSGDARDLLDRGRRRERDRRFKSEYEPIN